MPHLTNEGGLFPSLIHEFVNHGHKVFVSSRGKDIDKTYVEDEGGIPVLRIKSPEFTHVSNNIKKALAYQEYVIKQRHYVLKYWGKEKIDMIFSHSLPPELAYVVRGLKRHFGSKFYLEVPDFTWQDAVAYGFFKKNGPIGLYYRYWERKMFKSADYIGVPTKGNVKFIRGLYPWINESICAVFPFWQPPMSIIKKNVKKEFGLENKFVVIYGGSVGPAQKLEHLVDLAENTQEYDDIIFLVLGRGSKMEAIKKMASQKQLKNIVFKDFIPQKDYLQLLSSCDVGLIVLNEKHATPNFPSKTLSYFNLQVPVLAALDYVTDFGDYLEQTGTGLWCYSDDIETFKSQLLRLYNDQALRTSIRDNQKECFYHYMQPNYAYNVIIEQLNK